MRKGSNFRTTGISCLLSVLVALSGAISPAQAYVPAPADGQYVCTTGVLRTGDDTSPTYTITAGVVTSGVSCAGAVLIPEGVTEIGDSAFDSATGLTSISIPESVTKIGPWAFYGATGLVSITIPASVTSIGQEAFYGANGLSSISIPASVTSIGTWAIGETAVTSITVDSANPNYASQGGVLFNKDLTTLIAYPSGNTATSYVVLSSVTTIENSSFFASLFLKSITIPNSVTSIPPYAFGKSPNLETVTIPASVTNIGEYAFANASKLMDVNFLGNAPTTVGENAFSGIASGAKANISATATGFGTDATWNGLEIFGGEYVCTTGERRVPGDMSLAYIITNGVVTSGGNCAGAGLIPEGVRSIRYSAFDRASGLTSITIPASVTSIGEYAFASTPALSSIIFAQGSQLASIDQAVFYEATALTSISIPVGVTTIGRDAFEDARALMDVNFLGNAPTTVGENAFAGIASGAKANISATATGFGTQPTWNGLVVVKALPANGQYVCTTGVLRAGSDETSPTFTIDNGVVSDRSGSSCAGAVVIPEGVTRITSNAFRNASSLSSITIPASVTTIGEAAFRSSGLTSITFAQESQLTTIASFAFARTPLTSITIPASVRTPDYELADAFLDAYSLAAINVDPNNQTYSSIDGVLFNEGATTLVMYPFGKTETSYTIPSSVTTIFAGAFYTVEALTSITIPASVTTIEDWVFEDASALIDLYFLGNAPTDVDVDAFEGMSSGAKAHIKASAAGFGAGNPWTWNGLLIVQDGLKEVTYNSAGGTAVTSGVVTQGGSIQTAPVSTRAGYRFDGWSATDGGNIISFPYSPTASGDITLFAKWTLDQAVPEKAAEEARARVEEARARVIAAAQAEIRSTLMSGKPLTADQLLSADFKGVTSKNIGLVNADIAKLSEADKTDLKQIEKVVLKFAIVDKIANGKAFYPFELIAVGLIPEDSKNKSSITLALKKLPGSSRDTFEKIQVEIVSIEKKHADRKARLAAVLGKKR